jgi:hypothetical protein
LLPAPACRSSRPVCAPAGTPAAAAVVAALLASVRLLPPAHAGAAPARGCLLPCGQNPLGPRLRGGAIPQRTAQHTLSHYSTRMTGCYLTARLVPALDLAAAYIGRGFLLGRDHASTSEGSSPGRGPGHRAHEEAPGVAPAGPARKASNGRRLLNDRTPAVRRVNNRRATGSAEERRADGALGNNRRGSRSGRAYWGWWGGMRVAGRGLVWAGNFGKHPSFGGDGTVPFVCAVVVCGSRVRGIAVRI